MTKKMVWNEVDTLYPEGTVDHLIESLKQYDSSKGIFRVERCSRPYDDDYYYAIQESVLETDEQYNERVNAEEISRKRQDEWDRELFERLSKKFKGEQK